MTDTSDDDCLAEPQFSALTKAILQGDEPVFDESLGVQQITRATNEDVESHRKLRQSSPKWHSSPHDDVRPLSTKPFREPSRSAKAPQQRRVVRVKAVSAERRISTAFAEDHVGKQCHEPVLDKACSPSEVSGVPEHPSPVQTGLRAIPGDSIRRPARRFMLRYDDTYDDGHHEIALDAWKGQGEIHARDVAAVVPTSSVSARLSRADALKVHSPHVSAGKLSLSAGHDVFKRTTPPPEARCAETAAKPKQPEATTMKRRGLGRILLNNVPYTIISRIGKGGSGRVYGVTTPDNDRILALKTVSLRDLDPGTMKEIKGEVEHLTRLTHANRIIHLVDWELNEAKQILYLLMEYGQVDLESILKNYIHADDAKLDLTLVRKHWGEMLESVKFIHEENIVHSDLKPANFLLSDGTLKLIDFGIANRIPDDTVHVHRECQIGTPNYMAPEALLDSDGYADMSNSKGKLIKVGKPSDIWSLGCILYRMVYGALPFGHIQGLAHKALAITDPHHVITYPETGIGDVHVPAACIRTIKSCLRWDRRQRPTVQALLTPSQEFLFPDHLPDDTVSIGEETFASLISSVIREVNDSMATEEVGIWSAAIYKKLEAITNENH